jgi:hypothetical protein
MTPMPENVRIQLYHTLGGIIFSYGFVDSLVATVCRVLFEDLGGHPSQKQAFRPMGVRLRYMEKCFRNKPELAEMTEDALFLVARIRELDDLRNYLVHGCMTEYFPDGEAFQFTKVDMNSDRSGYEQWSKTLTHAQLAEMAQACTYVVRGLTPIGKRLEGLAGARKGQ